MIHFMRHRSTRTWVGIDQVWNNQDYLVVAMELAEGRPARPSVGVHVRAEHADRAQEQVCMYLGTIAEALDS